ncbi:TPA: hypothetical protein N0F65_012170 [Lagenidium giganteum]|uniref:Uncharacterized protein n=1 Tax=Lagenidium giganteum TaxID=4803 RepID=A0AAV2YTA0_9STRA|nr:TPA: hypothetical protein N0F65_012170 [Lagenidium giganteum]
MVKWYIATEAAMKRRHGRWHPVLAGLLLLACVSLWLQWSELPSSRFAVHLEPLSPEDEGAGWRRDTPLTRADIADDLRHMVRLHDACMTKAESHIITWRHGIDQDHNNSALIPRNDTKRLYNELKRCPDVDVYHPDRCMGSGYCEDFAAFTKYLESRILPQWAINMTFVDPATGRSVSYMDLCPTTPLLVFNHYADDLLTSSLWPTSKPVYLMPNIEMHELGSFHLRRADVVLCRTRVCVQHIRAWYKQYDDPQKHKVVYTRHTSTDPVTRARMATPGGASDAKGWEISDKRFEDLRFLHTAGGSPYKGTTEVLDCWLSKPQLPPLDLYIHEDRYNASFQSTYGGFIAYSKNVHLHTGNFDAQSFAQVTAQAAYFLGPSVQEGYGHYLNQARASGGLIITTDVPPMNELVDNTTGLLERTRRAIDPHQLLGGDFSGPFSLHTEGLVAVTDGLDICRAVQEMIAGTDAVKRRVLAQSAQQRYFQDTRFFAERMKQVKLHAQDTSRGNHPALRVEA